MYNFLAYTMIIILIKKHTDVVLIFMYKIHLYHHESFFTLSFMRMANPCLARNMFYVIFIAYLHHTYMYEFAPEMYKNKIVLSSHVWLYLLYIFFLYLCMYTSMCKCTQKNSQTNNNISYRIFMCLKYR